ncbi:type VII secretion protein EccB [Catenulispora sp. NL8]|uniref:Type VII secretion protein EccB n=1 Tax=Catenulispora pinistramenti TaxID=2705254 RepID=A0ABS5L334_9ACTN|nr:type VII secretion protein EccB [Catenulispora pinistramenti]MBS2552742.1 type VII secretion protein EccB [Catenulispora pinistramenti]
MSVSRRDLAQAHAFGVGRLLSALLRGDPDEAHPATGRMIGGTVGSLGLALLGTLGIGVYGASHPRDSGTWRTPGAVIQVRETGERLVLIDGVLHPVLNFTSARLLAGSTPSVLAVGQSALDGTPRGLPVGLPGAPDAVPAPDQLVTGPWSTCAEPGTGGAPSATMVIGARPGGLTVDAGHALVVSAPDGTLYLIWNGTRLRVPDAHALIALGYPPGLAPRLVDATWLDSVPQGPDLSVPAAPAGTVAVLGRTDVKLGTVFAVTGTGAVPDYFLARRDGLAPISQTDALLTAFQNKTRIDDSATRAQLAAEPRIIAGASVPGHPPTPVPLQDGPVATCSVAWTADAPPTIVLAASQGSASQPRVRVAGGHGALVRAQPAPGVATGTLYLITDTGLKYPLPSADVAGRLGYAGVTPAAVPTQILALIPTGTTLDPVAAAAYHDPSTTGTAQ